MEKHNPTRMFLEHIFNWKTILDAWLPILGYYFILKNYGLTEAIFSIAIYGVVIDLLLFRKRNLVIYALIAIGLVELLLIWIVPKEYISEALAYKISFSSLQWAIVLIAFSFFKNPIPKIMAERFNPKLLDWEEYKQPHYQKVWQEIALVWIVVSIFKSITFFYMASTATDSQVGMASQFMGWPVFGALMYFSFYWSSKRWGNFSTGSTA